jgi:hypothetical protein
MEAQTHESYSRNVLARTACSASGTLDARGRGSFFRVRVTPGAQSVQLDIWFKLGLTLHNL